MTKRSSLYHWKTGQMGPIFKMASENRTVRKPDHSASGQELNSLKPDGQDFGC
jgi:hypothetical protein